MSYRTTQVNFSKGVLSRRLLRRTDVQAYGSGLLVGNNIIVHKTGGFSIRPGFRYVGEVIDDDEVLFPFQFSNEQTYALAMGQGYMQPLAFGGAVLEEEDGEGLALIGATNADPVVLNVAYHGYSAGDQIFVPAGNVVGMTELNGRVWTVLASLDDNHFSIDADGTAWGTFVSAAGGATRAGTPPPPPPPPPVPPPPPPPSPPATGGGGGGGYGGGSLCVADDTLLLMANAEGNGPGERKQARFCKAGDKVWTRPEATLGGAGSEVWGAYPIEAIEFAYLAVYVATIDGQTVRATPLHRFWVNDGWTSMRMLGIRDGSAWVAKITVAVAHTYVSGGVLSHNAKEYSEPY